MSRQPAAKLHQLNTSFALTVIGNSRKRQTDSELVVQARLSGESSAAAFGELVRRYQRMVYALALSLVRDADVDDVAQDAFLRALRNLDLLADPAKFGVWLRRITFGVAIDHVRADRARNPSSVGLAELDGEQGEEEPADPSLSPLQRVERGEVVDRVLAALDRLPARYRVPLTLYHIDGLTHSKVASVLDVPESTVRSLVARARRKLARLLANSPEVRDMTDGSPSLHSSTDVLDDPSPTMPRFLHVLNGDSVRGTLEQSDVPGTFAVYADVLHEGPVSSEIGTAAARDARARYLATAGYLSFADALRTGETWESRLETYASYDEVVLWFEHDLFDQLLLIRHLAWWSQRERGRTALSLICIGEFPGFEPFHGLGQLEADQLSSLLGTRARVSSEQFSLGRRAWRAFTASEPTALGTLASSDGGPLPFLPGALRRFIEEYPAVDTGLPRTERQMLELLAGGPMSPGQLFVAWQRREERTFMGDTTFWRRMLDLASGDTPLISVDAERADDLTFPRGSTVAITDAGREVLADRADWVRLNGFDRWLGGVHLLAPLGGEVRWRYDVGIGSLVAM